MNFETPAPAFSANDEAARLVKLLEAEQAKELGKTNAPRFRPPFKSGGKIKKGFWYVWEEGKQVALTKYGALPSDDKKPGKESKASAWKAWEAYKQAKATGQKEEVKRIAALALEAVKPITAADVVGYARPVS